jgi:hypothetical protein
MMGGRPARTPVQDWRSTVGRIERLEWVRVALRTDWKWRGRKYRLAMLTKLSVKQMVRLARLERVRRRGGGRTGWRAPLASQSMKGVVSTPPPMSRLRVLGEAYENHNDEADDGDAAELVHDFDADEEVGAGLCTSRDRAR